METNLKIFSLRMTSIHDEEPKSVDRTEIKSSATPSGNSDEYIVNNFEADKDFIIVSTSIYILAKTIGNKETNDIFYLYNHKTKFIIIGDIREFSPSVIAESTLVHCGRAAFEIAKDSSKKGKAYGIEIPSLAKVLLWVEPLFNKS